MCSLFDPGHTGGLAVSALKAEGLTVRTTEGPDFEDVDLELAVGEAAAVTSIGLADLRKLLEVLAGITQADKGRVSWNRLPALAHLENPNLTTYRRYRARRGLRQQSGYVSASLSLINQLSIFDNIALPLLYHFNPPEATVRERTYRLMEQLHLTEFADERPAGLPLGVTRRASVGRALILEPTIVFLDSPLSDIDNDSAELILSVLRYYRDRTGLAILAASFEPRTLLPLVSRVFVFHQGREIWVLQGDELHETEFFERMSRLQDEYRREELVL